MTSSATCISECSHIWPSARWTLNSLLSDFYRDHLPVDVLAQFQLGHRRDPHVAVHRHHQHLPLPGCLRALRLRRLQLSGAQRKTGHGRINCTQSGWPRLSKKVEATATLIFPLNSHRSTFRTLPWLEESQWEHALTWTSGRTGPCWLDWWLAPSPPWASSTSQWVLSRSRPAKCENQTDCGYFFRKKTKKKKLRQN